MTTQQPGQRPWRQHRLCRHALAVGGAVLLVLLAACGGSDWRAGFVWDGQGDDDDGRFVIVVTRWPATAAQVPDGELAAHLEAAAEHWSVPLAQAAVPVRAELVQLSVTPPRACDASLPIYELVLQDGQAQTRYLSDHGHCAGTAGAPVTGFIDHAALQRMAELLEQPV